ncbi:hypothetical protein BDU57DRAFT_539413 [Ampelomyces quisqualis]|uniref:BHLH domain-containing protein n=1 Tax=Ampelomyces quisqualis TaxID=50730 RepID=A0A6A5QHI1_AMPQU|nr:hypothetical protein BDU57DRAFT_539413 [Ampelomyces quisqualis]
MPKPTCNFPPTPTASLDITGKSGANAPRLDNGLTLPPAALDRDRGSVASSSGPSDNASDSSYRPISPSSPVATLKPGCARKRLSATSQQSVVTKDDYSLPPPPTRSRKIIQMKPKNAQEATSSQSHSQNARGAAAPATTANGTGTKKKQTSSTGAAGRKIARKTAHSLIERRRRLKMNEGFGVLKDMIPACRGQEMHKLAVLQASIEYMRYLEQCIADLKTAHSNSPSSAVSGLGPLRFGHVRDDEADDEDEEDEDEDMEDATSPTQVDNVVSQTTYPVAPPPAMCPSDRSVYSQSTTTSPAILPHDRGHNWASLHQSSDPHRYSLASPTTTRSMVTSPSIHLSPVFSAYTPANVFSNTIQSSFASTGPVAAPGSSHSAAAFSLTSPMLAPLADHEDHEATEALLMLNTDRRSWNGARGMSVKDLLSG